MSFIRRVAAGRQVRRGATFFHGTSPEAVAKILAQGLLPSGRKYRGRAPSYRLRSALALWEPGGARHRAWEQAKTLPLRSPERIAADKDAEAFWDQFYDQAAEPLRGGWVHLARDPKDVLTRGEDAEGWEYMLEVATTGPVVPDEDWLGAVMAHTAYRGMPCPPWENAQCSQDLRALTLAALSRLPTRLRRDIWLATDGHGADDATEWKALVGKEVIYALMQSGRGRRILTLLAEYGPMVAHRGAPRVIRVFRGMWQQAHGTGDSEMVWEGQPTWAREKLYTVED